ncbi:MAG TPA: SusD/RagB family nutrient-binding outer membrane lipoprotein, partial [Flavisolibacter sp.]|nr:SusD/RagB family nutrient-binding outer membrane lipoprotein [Flavisolibacter sp.]
MNKNINKLLCVSFVGILLAGCTKDFKEINTNPSGVKPDVFLADFQAVVLPLQNAQRNIIHQVNWEYQLQENLNADIYGGFMTPPTPFNGNN